MRRVDRFVVASKLYRRPQRDTNRAVAAHELVGQMDGVLPIRHHDALLDGDARQLVPPDRQAKLQPELDEVIGPIGSVRTGHFIFIPEPDDLPIVESNSFEQMVQEHHPPERRRQCRHEQAVIPPRQYPDNGA